MKFLILASGFKSLSRHWCPLLIVSILLFIPVFFQGNDSIQAVKSEDDLDRGLIAYYPFNGNAKDESGGNQNGTVNGASWTADRFGNAQSAYHFDGKDDFIKVPVNINPDVLPQVTIVAWVRADKIQHISQVVSHDNAGYDRSLGIDNRGGGNGWSAFSGSGAVLGYHPVKLKVWTFIAVVYDQHMKTVTLFVDGKKYEKKGNLSKGLDYLYIGSNPSFGSFFSGDIDDVYIYKRALSTAELETLYQKK